MLRDAKVDDLALLNDGTIVKILSLKSDDNKYPIAATPMKQTKYWYVGEEECWTLDGIYDLSEEEHGTEFNVSKVLTKEEHPEYFL